MTTTSRRGFLAAGGIGAAAAGAGLFAPGVAQAAEPAAATTRALPGRTAAGVPAVAGPIVAHIQDVTTGEISVMVGERAVVLRDPALVAALARAVARS